jgi:hypothetical protein
MPTIRTNAVLIIYVLNNGKRPQENVLSVRNGMFNDYDVTTHVTSCHLVMSLDRSLARLFTNAVHCLGGARRNRASSTFGKPATVSSIIRLNVAIGLFKVIAIINNIAIHR